jgi:hypothetical protein
MAPKRNQQQLILVKQLYEDALKEAGMSKEILEGPWEEIVRHADEFSGKRVRLIVIEDEVLEGSNEAMLAALREVAEIQDGMRLTAGEDSLRLLREAREGGMDGLDSGQ